MSLYPNVSMRDRFRASSQHVVAARALKALFPRHNRRAVHLRRQSMLVAPYNWPIDLYRVRENKNNENRR